MGALLHRRRGAPACGSGAEACGSGTAALQVRSDARGSGWRASIGTVTVGCQAEPFWWVAAPHVAVAAPHGRSGRAPLQVAQEHGLTGRLVRCGRGSPAQGAAAV
jgi:hypothetical protein